MIDRFYRTAMLVFMLAELVLLGWLVAIEARNTTPMIYRHEIESVRPDPPAPGRYVEFGAGPLILDTQTGAVCNSYVNEPQLPGGYPLCPGAGK